jgi:hypothetical protein
LHQEFQEHAGAANAATPAVIYYDYPFDPTHNADRLRSVTYTRRSTVAEIGDSRAGFSGKVSGMLVSSPSLRKRRDSPAAD